MIITAYAQQFNPYPNDIGSPYQYGIPSMPYMPHYQQQPASNVDWIYVNGIEGARNQIVQPGHIRWMMDNNEPIIYAKAVDATGTVTLKCFYISEFDPTSPAPKEKKVEYVTKEEFDGLKSMLLNLQNELGGLPNA